MKQNSVVVSFEMIRRKQRVDIDVPLEITAKELVSALSDAYGLGIDTDDMKKCYLQAENPVALLRGSRTLEAFGLRNGSRIYFTGE